VLKLGINVLIRPDWASAKDENPPEC